jgi:hypothetical protein
LRSYNNGFVIIYIVPLATVNGWTGVWKQLGAINLLALLAVALRLLATDKQKHKTQKAYFVVQKRHLGVNIENKAAEYFLPLPLPCS